MDNEHSGRQRDRPGKIKGRRGNRSAKTNDVPGRLAGWLGRWGADLLLVLGAGCICAGAAWIYPPAGPITAGALLIAGGVLWARGGDGP